MVRSPIEWNHNLIDETFLSFESAQIKQIPLIQEVQEDQYMWMYTKQGTYSVRSGYNAIEQWKKSGHQGSSNANNLNDLWKKVWTLKTIPRHQDFTWRILNDSLHVRSELSRRGIRCDLLCPICHIKMETVNHIFMECPRAQMIWFGSNLGINFSANNNQNFKEWLSMVINNMKEDIIIQTIAIAYGIWYARNKMVFENREITPYLTISNATKCIS